MSYPYSISGYDFQYEEFHDRESTIASSIQMMMIGLENYLGVYKLLLSPPPIADTLKAMKEVAAEEKKV